MSKIESSKTPSNRAHSSLSRRLNQKKKFGSFRYRQKGGLRSVRGTNASKSRDFKKNHGGMKCIFISKHYKVKHYKSLIREGLEYFKILHIIAIGKAIDTLVQTIYEIRGFIIVTKIRTSLTETIGYRNQYGNPQIIVSIITKNEIMKGNSKNDNKLEKRKKKKEKESESLSTNAIGCLKQHKKLQIAPAKSTKEITKDTFDDKQQKRKKKIEKEEKKKGKRRSENYKKLIEKNKKIEKEKKIEKKRKLMEKKKEIELEKKITEMKNKIEKLSLFVKKKENLNNLKNRTIKLFRENDYVNLFAVGEACSTLIKTLGMTLGQVGVIKKIETALENGKGMMKVKLERLPPRILGMCLCDVSKTKVKLTAGKLLKEFNLFLLALHGVEKDYEVNEDDFFIFKKKRLRLYLRKILALDEIVEMEKHYLLKVIDECQILHLAFSNGTKLNIMNISINKDQSDDQKIVKVKKIFECLSKSRYGTILICDLLFPLYNQEELQSMGMMIFSNDDIFVHYYIMLKENIVVNIRSENIVSSPSPLKVSKPSSHVFVYPSMNGDNSILKMFRETDFYSIKIGDLNEKKDNLAYVFGMKIHV